MFKKKIVIIVPKKYIKRSVDRNLMKRRIRNIIYTSRRLNTNLFNIGFKIICTGLYKYSGENYNNIINIINKNTIKYAARKYTINTNKI